MKLLTLGLQRFFSCILLVLAASSPLPAEEIAKSENGNAAETVREALQREVYGLGADRDRLLAAAIAADPENAAARWLAGFVRSSDGRWVKAGQQKLDFERQALLATYQELRLLRRDTADEQLALADWCGKNRLPDQERAHLLRVCQLVPDHAVARKRLGFEHVGTEWVSREDRARQLAAKEAEEQWTETLQSLIANLSAEKAKTRRFALEQLKQIRDPAALPALQAVVAGRGEELEMLAVEITAQITDPAAAVSLARHAVLSSSARVRKLATTKLASYDQEAYVPSLVATLYTPFTSEYSAFNDGKQIHYQHQLLREGLTRRERLLVEAGYLNASPNGNQALSKQTAFQDATATARRLESEAEEFNNLTKVLNERIAALLRTATGAALPAEPAQWWKWWTEHTETFVEGAKPTATVHHMVSINVTDRGLKVVDSGRRDSLSNPIQPRYDCFAAGTPVWTEQGQVAIEQVRVGDLVLSRDVETGELAYKPVVRTTIRPPGQLVCVRVGKEIFETSSGHLFWVSGEGWVKSRDLRSGMVLHTATGPARVSEVSRGGHTQTYNLVVADFNTYFVGQQQVLSHDNTVKRTVNCVVPGLKAE